MISISPETTINFKHVIKHDNINSTGCTYLPIALNLLTFQQQAQNQITISNKPLRSIPQYGIHHHQKWSWCRRGKDQYHNTTSCGPRIVSPVNISFVSNSEKTVWKYSYKYGQWCTLKHFVVCCDPYMELLCCIFDFSEPSYINQMYYRA